MASYVEYSRSWTFVPKVHDGNDPEIVYRQVEDSGKLNDAPLCVRERHELGAFEGVPHIEATFCDCEAHVSGAEQADGVGQEDVFV